MMSLRLMTEQKYVDSFVTMSYNVLRIYGHVSGDDGMYSESKNKARIVDAAMDLFARRGFDNVSVKDICETAGVPRSSFYLAFSGKTDILAYKLQSVKGDFQQSIPDFIRAENDFERIWFLTDAYLKKAVQFGPEISKQYFILELKGDVGLFSIIESFNDWLIQLVANCQKQGIIRSQTPPQNIVPLLIALAKAHLFDWVCCDGQFPLQSTLRKSYETFLDVAPEFRA